MRVFKHTAFTVMMALIGVCQAQTFPACPSWTHQMTFVNSGDTTVTIRETPGCFANTNSQPPFNGGRCWPMQTPGEFQVKPGLANAVKLQLPSCWSGNFGVKCDTCKSGVQTLAEATFDGGLDASYKKLPGLIDTYDVSLVDGFSKALRIAPDKNVQPGGGSCASAGCQSAPVCPAKLVDGDACTSPNQYVLRNAAEFTDTDRKKYGCVCATTGAAACVDNDAMHAVPTGCVGEFGCSPFSQPGQTHPDSACCPYFNDATQKCSATSQDRAWDTWALDYISTVHKNCPGEYAWQFDDEHGTFTCQGTAQTPMNYTITVSPVTLLGATPSIVIHRVASSAGAVTGVPAPGSIATVYVSGLDGIRGVNRPSGGFLPRELLGVRVTVAGIAAPIFSIANLETHQQIEIQIPWEAASRFPVEVTQGAEKTSIARSAENGWGALFTDAGGNVLAQHASDYSLITAAKPAGPGEWIIAYATNLGAVEPRAITGEVARSSPLSLVYLPSGGSPSLELKPLLRSGGVEKAAQFSFAGLTPGTVGVYQINLRIPDGLPPGESSLILQRTEGCPEGQEGLCGFKGKRITFSNVSRVALGRL